MIHHIPLAALPTMLAFAAWPGPASAAATDDFDQLHSCVCRVGDCDGDGVPDLAVAARNARREGNFWVIPGRIRVISGKTGKLLWMVSGKSSGDGFGACLSPAGDVDGDGAADLIVGAIALTMDLGKSLLGPAAVGLSYARVHSGKDGRVLHDFTSASRTQYVGFAVSGELDFDTDGRSDVLVGAPAIGQRSECVVYSGKTGEALLRIASPEPRAARFGAGVAFLGDIDGDSRSEIAVSSPEGTDGAVYICSGKDGSVLRKVGTAPTWLDYGWVLAVHRDASDMKSGRLVLSAPNEGVEVWTLDGSKRIATLLPKERKWHMDGFGASLEVAVLTKGREPQLLLGANDWDNDEHEKGYADLMWLDGKAAVRLTEAKSQGVDACFAGDVDADGWQDIATVAVKDDVLEIHSTKEGKLLRKTKLAELDVSPK